MRACNRVLKPGGVTAYLVIVDADEALASEAMSAGGLGGGLVRTGVDYVDLMAAAGFLGVALAFFSGSLGAGLSTTFR